MIPRTTPSVPLGPRQDPRRPSPLGSPITPCRIPGFTRTPHDHPSIRHRFPRIPTKDSLPRSSRILHQTFPTEFPTIATQDSQDIPLDLPHNITHDPAGFPTKNPHIIPHRNHNQD
ncbi:hypothetical protein L798_02517 [Zootermopsis nevadensis]|uniref:Uncharacterized protein n=1 Tax=Zootermopsis nevadensis TaxID=136037 RepID=A0A067RR25_ZOONE|nr:hypothetical protein L798_02517 [Zootermopsis nevadensis]